MKTLPAEWFLWWAAGLAFFLCLPAYAEIHFRLPGFRGKLFQPQPEIVFDLPGRAKLHQPVPLFLLIKDAHVFPVQLEEVRVTIVSEPGARQSWHRKLSMTVTAPLWWQHFVLPASLFPESGVYQMFPELHYRIGGKAFRAVVDNYPDPSHPPLTVQICAEPWPTLPGWHWGDLHVHSAYTRDQLEFGAPLPVLREAARTLGLTFLAVTDHSYDLEPPQPEPLVAAGGQPPWLALQQEVEQMNRSGEPIVLRGEEVSAGNARNENVHLLLLGNRQFYPGRGDGGRKFWQNRPTSLLKDLLPRVEREEPHVLTCAAHPFSVPPLSQRWILRRGSWNRVDLQLPSLHAWQILNGPLDEAFWQGLALWQKALLQGQRRLLLAGSDAHGNLNGFRQVSIPLWRLVRQNTHFLGQARTGVYLPGEISEKTLLHALRKGCTVISSGPLIVVELWRDEQKYHIGDETPATRQFGVRVQAVSTPELGPIEQVWLRAGCFQSQGEISLPLRTSSKQHRLECCTTLDLPGGNGYLRAELLVRNQQQLSYCFTNPIWIGKKSH